MFNVRKTKCLVKWLDKSSVFCLNLVILLIISTPSVISSSSNNNSVEPDTKEICSTRGCKEAARLISINVNEDVDPCDDFYEFACGGFVEKMDIPKDKSSYSRLVRLQDKVMHEVKRLLEADINTEEPRIFSLVRKFYRACMDETTIEKYGLEPLQSIIEKLGGWPVVAGDAWDENKFDWTEVDNKLGQMGFNPKNIFNIFVFNDIYYSSKNLLYIDPLVPQINTASLNKGFRNGVVAAYYSYMIDVAILLGADSNRAVLELKDAVGFEMQLAQAMSSKNGTDLKMYTINELQEFMPSIPWSKYLNGFTEPIAHLEDIDVVAVSNPHYLLNLKDILTNTSNRVIANYMIWRTIADAAPHLSSDIRKLAMNFKMQSTNDDTKPERWKDCLNFVTDKKGLTVGVSSLYVRKFFHNVTREAVAPILDSIINEFHRQLNKTPWIDRRTKAHALKKSDFMKHIIGYPSELLSDETIDNYTQSLKIDEHDHFNNVLNINCFHFNYSISGLQEASDQRLWVVLSDSTLINAYYYVLNNAFILLAGILQPPIFKHDWPDYAKFGSIGFIIGHEMMHAYDLKNAVFDETGSYNPWFSTDVRRIYTERVQCFIDQYGNFEDELLGINVDGNLTINENLADNVGLQISYNAYKKWRETQEKEVLLPGLNYTPEQIFWITSVNFLCRKSTPKYRLKLFLTEEHTPDNFRTIGVLSNLPDFAKAFNCPIDSRMNPKRKCEFW